MINLHNNVLVILFIIDNNNYEKICRRYASNIIENMKKTIICINGEQGEQPLTYGDPNGRPLHFPDNNV